MKVLVTGTQGQVARSLLQASAAFPELELLAVGRPDLDLEQPGCAEQFIARISPGVVINAAAFTAVDQAEQEPEKASRVNAQAAGEIARAAAAAGAPIIQLSTDYVFDGNGEGPYSEAAPTGPMSEYGRSKLAGEEQVRAGNEASTIVRTAWVFSPFGRNFVKTMIGAAAQRDVLTVVDDQVGSPTSALDLAAGLLTVARAWNGGSTAGQGETYHLAGSGHVSWCGFASAIMDECSARGWPSAEVRPVPTSAWLTPARRPANSVLDCGKFEHDFGFSMPHWRQSLTRVIDQIAETQ